MKPELSIIIPCYNCENTLKEAVDSCFMQEIKDFEIIMVDDGSTDTTREIMINLASKYKEVKLFFHDKNKGGGATRNTAVEHTSSDTIFCLDGDDILGNGALKKMLDLMNKENCDGVLFEETRFFYDKNTSKIEIQKNDILGRNVLLFDLFSGKHGTLTQVNFMYRKEAFQAAEGYPTHHGFDTQAFGFKFLSKRHKVLVCEGTYYLHRRNRKENSYFMREYKQGKLSYNTYLMYEDIIDSLSDEVIESLLDFDVANQNVLGENNLVDFFKKKLELFGKEKFFSKNNPSKYDEFKKAIHYYKEMRYDDSLKVYSKIICDKPGSQVLQINILRNFLAKNTEDKNIEDLVYNTLFKQSKIIKKTFISRIYKKLKKVYLNL